MPRTFLVIEDEPGDVKLLEMALHDATLHVAHTVAEGLALLAPDRGLALDAVLLDMGLPDADGLQAIEAIAEPAHRRGAKVLVVTGLEQRWTRDMARRGADGILFKEDVGAPERLRAQIRKHFDESLGRQEYQLQQGLLVGERVDALLALFDERVPAAVGPQLLAALEALQTMAKGQAEVAALLKERLPPAVGRRIVVSTAPATAEMPTYTGDLGADEELTVVSRPPTVWQKAWAAHGGKIASGILTLLSAGLYGLLKWLE